MEITITGRHLEVTPALKEFCEERVRRLARHAPRGGSVSFILKVERHLHIVEAAATIDGFHLSAVAEGPEMYGSIEAVTAKLDRQFARKNEKRADHRVKNLGSPPGAPGKAIAGE